MELKEILRIIEGLPTETGLVEVVHKDKQGNSETTPGYLGRGAFSQRLLMTMERYETIDDVPEMWREGFREEYKNPYVELHPSLDRNGCRTGEPHKLKLSDITNIYPLAVVPLKSK